MDEEKKIKVGELAGLKIQNVILKLQLLESEAKKLVAERDQIIKAEADLLGIDISKYGFDVQALEFVERKPE